MLTHTLYLLDEGTILRRSQNTCDALHTHKLLRLGNVNVPRFKLSVVITVKKKS